MHTHMALHLIYLSGSIGLCHERSYQSRQEYYKAVHRIEHLDTKQCRSQRVRIIRTEALHMQRRETPMEACA